MPQNSLEDDFYATAGEILQCLHVGPEQLAQTAKGLPRLKGKSWFLTKVVRVFNPPEMRDLDFAPAIPELAKHLSRPAGRVAAEVLSEFGSNAASLFATACKSKNPVERMNGASGFEHLRDRGAIEPLLHLLKDESPQVRLYAIRAAGNNWDRRFADPVAMLFHDPSQEIRSEAVGCLSMHEGRDRTAIYLALLKQSDPNVRLCALGVLERLNREAIPSGPLVDLLKNPNEDVQCAALHVIWRLNRETVGRADLLPLLGSSRRDTVMIAIKLMEGNGHVQPELPEPYAWAREQEQRKRWLSSVETAPLATNRLAIARLMGLKIWERNADAAAVELLLPLLKDSNRIVRSRAFAALRNVAGKDISQTDPKMWEQWWAANKASFILQPQGHRQGDMGSWPTPRSKSP